MKKLFILFVSILAFTACSDDSENSVTATVIIENNRLTFGGFTVSTDYKVTGITLGGDSISVSASVSSGGHQAVFLSNEEMEEGSELCIYANGSNIYSQTLSNSISIIYHDEPSPHEDWIANY
ncbi:hypothetical protein EYV94_07450 [Puteibacter caeruleilacunae]|nr:hypothetical protein EYV94_07450 [Puteibacter caeruleilacunae]